MSIPQILAETRDASLALTVEKNTNQDGVARTFATLAGNPAGLRALARILTVMADTMADDDNDDPTPWSITMSPEDIGFFQSMGAAALTLRADPGGSN